MSYFDGLLQFIAIGRHNDCKQFAALHACYSCALSTNASNIIMDPMFLTSGHTHEGCSELSGGSTMAVCCFAGLHACYVSSTVGESFSVSVRHIWLAVCLLVLPGRTASQIEL